MLNPNKYVRKAYLTLLSGISVPIFNRRIPINLTIPATYILISSQSTNISRENKCGHGWEVSVTLDIVSTQDVSFVDVGKVDDIEQEISDRLDLWTNSQTEIEIPPFVVYHTTFQNSQDFELETDTQTQLRKVVRYNHILNGI